MIVVDASWVIALGDANDEHHSAAAALSLTLADPQSLHPVTLAECLVDAARVGRHRELGAHLRDSFDMVEMDDDAPVRWAEIRASERLRLPDAVVLDTALRARASAIATFDERLAAAARRRGIEVVP